MSAEILHYLEQGSTEESPGGSGGTWETSQDPLTGEIRNVWVPDSIPDDPDTPENEASVITVPCIARGIISAGVQSGGTDEIFGDLYMSSDNVRMTVPAWVEISENDRVTNIREAKTGKVVWKNRVYDNSPTVFNVNGVTPLFDPFNRHIENFILLEKVN